MASYNAVTSNAALSAGDFATIYTCPSDKSHAVVDIDFFRPLAVDGPALFTLAVTSHAATAIVDTDYLLGNPNRLDAGSKCMFINKVIVGKNQSVYVRCTLGSLTVRLSGVEELNPVILEAGMLAGLTMAGPANYITAFKTSFVDTAAISMVSASIRNNSASSVGLAAYISNSATPSPGDHIDSFSLAAGRYVVMQNMLMKPNETLYFKTYDETSPILDYQDNALQTPANASVFINVNGLTQS
jgi:hypothetical protein